MEKLWNTENYCIISCKWDEKVSLNQFKRSTGEKRGSLPCFLLWKWNNYIFVRRVGYSLKRYKNKGVKIKKSMRGGDYIMHCFESVYSYILRTYEISWLIIHSSVSWINFKNFNSLMKDYVTRIRTHLTIKSKKYLAAKKLLEGLKIFWKKVESKVFFPGGGGRKSQYLQYLFFTAFHCSLWYDVLRKEGFMRFRPYSIFK